MDKQLTVGELIKFLEKIRKNHGDDVLVYHVECGQITKSCSVRATYVEDDNDGNPNVSVVIDQENGFCHNNFIHPNPI